MLVSTDEKGLTLLEIGDTAKQAHLTVMRSTPSNVLLQRPAAAGWRSIHRARYNLCAVLLGCLPYP